MPELENLAPMPRKVMTLFYVVDTSGSMHGSKIQSVNAAMEETMAQLDAISKSNDDAEIRVAVLSFDTQARWLTPNGPVEPMNFKPDLSADCGLTALGAAYKELESKLSRSEFLDTKAGAYPPVILLLTDGEPTDNTESGLEKLRHNNWFKRAIKVAFAIGSDAREEELKKFTGSKEGVLNVSRARELQGLLNKVAVITSEFQSRSAGVGDDKEDVTETTKALVEEATQAAKDENPEPFVKKNDDDDDEWKGWD